MGGTDRALVDTTRARTEIAPIVAGPVVKWAGGKTRLLPELIARMPKRYGRYFEPFAGGAALFFRIAPERAVIGDLNADLVSMYAALADDVEGVIRGLRRHAAAHSERHYYAVREAWNTVRASWSRARAAAAFIYLNKTCFNGLFRVNRSGEFNVPMGRYESPTICVPDALRGATSLLQRAELRAGDYRKTLRDAGSGDVVYLDPPYHPASSVANFTSYTAASFDQSGQVELAETARDLVARGCYVMLSNSDTAFTRELYDGFRIERVQCSRSINSAGARRGAVDELIIIGNRSHP